MSIVLASGCDILATIAIRINVPVTWMIFLIFGGTIIGICLNSLIFCFVYIVFVALIAVVLLCIFMY